MNGKPIAVERFSSSILTFKKNEALVSPLLDPHVRARAELALAPENPFATRLWRMPALDFWLEGVNGRSRPPSGDALSKPPSAARNASESTCARFES
jgi:hypothetical protein